MAPRTRATATTAPPANLAAAPRRRVKITPLDKDDSKITKAEPTIAPVTRATRSKKTTTPAEDELATANSKSTTTKSRGRPKKSEPTIDEEVDQPLEKPAEKPKRATRSTRATATTVSSEAKEKPAAKATRAPKSSTKSTRATKAEPETVPIEDEPVKIAEASASKVAPKKKKVTFQDIEDDKENQPVTRATRKTASTKSTRSTSTVSGLKAKPVRKPATATRASKRTKEQTSDDEDERKPNKIQRVLTPKKINQVARPLTPDEASEDELNGGKTPVRDLNLSPKRPHSSAIIEAVAKTMSPAKKLDFSQSLAQQSVKKGTDADKDGALMSPARRLPTSPAKLFSQSTLTSATKIFRDDASNNLASPARRPVMSPVKEGEEKSSGHVFGDASKLLFPSAPKTSQVSSLSQTTSNLLQSPKRSAVFDPARIFAQSMVKPQTTDLSRSSFFSSPAKRIGVFSPLKKTTTPKTATKNGGPRVESPELDLNDMEVTNLMNDETIELTASSHQRASISPLRTYKLSEDEQQVDFDDSILEIRSPLKIAKSPVKTLAPRISNATVLQGVHEDDDATELLSSAQSTPRINHIDKSFVSLRAMDAEEGTKLKDSQPDLTLTDANDDTIALSEIAAEGTPRAVEPIQSEMDVSLDELAPSPQEDMVAKYLRTPGTPATINEHELTNMITSPVDEQQSPTMLLDGQNLTDVLSSPKADTRRTEIVSPASLHEHELTEMLSSPRGDAREAQITSPASLHEHELTRLAFTPKSEKVIARQSPASLHEHELTHMLSSPALVDDRELTEVMSLQHTNIVNVNNSPASVHEHELTNMLSSPHELDTAPERLSPVSLHEHELTNIMPSPQVEDVARDYSPASLHEHELTNMLSSPPPQTAVTPNLPIPRKFNLNTVVTKVPLKPEAQESPFKLNIKKRKRPLSLGGQPDFVDIIQRTSKSPRTSLSPDAVSSHTTPAVTPVVTPAPSRSTKTPASKVSTVKSTRRAVSTPNPARTPLAPVLNGALTGAVVYVDVRTSEGADASAIYIELLNELGAKVVSSVTDASLLTHIVYKDGNPKTLEKIRRASIGDGINAKVVRVSWVLDCDAKKEWVDENDYVLNLTPTDHVIGSVSRSAKRKSMEPSMLVADGSGSVKRSRSRNRASIRRSSIKPFVDNINTPGARSSLEVADHEETMATPVVPTAKKQADLEKNSLTAAWKSINANQNLGEDTPARRTLELLKKSYALEQDDWDSTMLSNNTNDDDDDNDNENDENTPRPMHQSKDKIASAEDRDLLETGLTPAPYRVQTQIGSAPAKGVNVGLMTYRERVEEMERREMRDNALGVMGGKAARGKGKRVTMFGGDFER